MKRNFSYTLPSGVSKKHIGSSEAFAQEIHDAIAACLLDESFDETFE